MMKCPKCFAPMTNEEFIKAFGESALLAGFEHLINKILPRTTPHLPRPVKKGEKCPMCHKRKR